jgi:hypothetical protein
LYGFPGETAEDYAAIGKAMESLWHLPPPYAMGAVRMDRFSPYFNQAAAFGLVNVRPMEMYRLLYPLPQDRLRNLAYFFEFDHPDGRAPAAFLGDVERRVEAWRKAATSTLTAVHGAASELLIFDTRPNAVHSRVAMSGVQREIYELCDSRHHVQGMMRWIAERYAVDGALERWLRDFLTQMVEWRLMANEGDEYLSLAVQQGSGFAGN